MSYYRKSVYRSPTGSSKPEVLGSEILQRLLNHDVNLGGSFIEATGSQGSAKTSVLLFFAEYNMNVYPKEKVFWSNPYKAPMQFLRLQEDQWHIFVKEGSNVTFHDRAKRLRQVHPANLSYFKSYDDLYDNAIPGKCNAVFFGDRKEWIDFMGYIVSVGEWTAVFFDELSEIASGYSSGDDWRKIGEFSLTLKELRKCLVTCVVNSQSSSDTDHRVRTKLMAKIFLPGAKSDGKSRVHQQAIDNLVVDRQNGNESWIEMDGRFGLVVWSDVYPPSKVSWEARCDGLQR